MSHHPGEFPGRPTDLAAEPIDHGPFHGGGPGPHVVDRHGLIRHRSDGVEEAGQGDRGGDLVADVPRIVQVVPVVQHLLNQTAEMVGQRVAVRAGTDACSSAARAL